ncbi:MAG TPA: hypothetical protein VM261_00355 [Kofleriaceae bacterium]|nr:hypothetical protein [Kofleriaceae bacterium]
MSSPGLSGKELLAWGDLDEQRRGRAPAWIAAGVIGLVLGAEMARRAGWLDGVYGVPSSTMIVAVLLAAFVPAMFGAPYRMFWRRDSPLLARLPIAGAALWYVAVVRAGRAAARSVVAVAPSLVVIAVGEPAIAARVAAFAAVMSVAAIALLPAVCLAAAFMVATGKATGLASAVGGGEVELPTTTWLGGLPATAIAGVVLAAIYGAPWMIDGVDSAGPIGLGIIAVAAVAAGAWGTSAAPKTYPLAMREVAALDRQIHAHLEIHPPTMVERAVRDRLGAAAPLHDRLARLLRRRYPLVVFAGAAGAATMVVIGLARPSELVAWLGAVSAGLGFLAGWLSRALARPPLELPRLTATLPVTPASVSTARTAYVGTWAALYLVVPTAIAAGISGRPVAAAITAAAGAVAGLLLGRLSR